MDFVHVGLVSSTAERAQRFFGELLGLPKTKESHLDRDFCHALFGVDHACDLIYYGDGTLVFEVFVTGRSEPSEGKISHTCIQTDDLDGLIERTEAMGFGVRKVPKGDKFVVFLEDADGNLFEAKGV